MPSAVSRPGLLQGRRLSEGDLVAVVSPASFPTAGHLADIVDELEGWGLRIGVGQHALAEHGFMAGTDEDRLADLNEVLRDPSVRAIFASRGGAGSYRIADDLDFDAVRADPKPLVGFSDITNLHLSLWANTGLSTIHGCVGRNQVAADVRTLLMEGATLTLKADSTSLTAPLRLGGSATGTLVGGNLRELAGAVGSAMPMLDGTIVFLEDLRHVGIGQVDRNLTQLIRSGAFDRIAGIALGPFDDFTGYVDRGWTVVDVLHDRLGGLGVPVLGGIKAGHGGTDKAGQPDQRALCLGAQATLDAVAGTLSMSSCVR